MKQILEVSGVVVAGAKYTAKDPLGRYHTIHTDKVLIPGQSVLLINQVVIRVVPTATPTIHEV